MKNKRVDTCCMEHRRGHFERVVHRISWPLDNKVSGISNVMLDAVSYDVCYVAMTFFIHKISKSIEYACIRYILLFFSQNVIDFRVLTRPLTGHQIRRNNTKIYFFELLLIFNIFMFLNTYILYIIHFFLFIKTIIITH